MNKYVFVFIAAVFVVVSARPEPPLEGERLDPELLSRIRELLLQDGPGFGSNGSPSSGRNVVTGGSTYSNPALQPPSFQSSYGVPSASVNPIRSIAPATVAPGGGIMLLDPELAPLLSAFDLSVTSENHGRSGGY